MATLETQKDGWMTKEGGRFKSWKKRWFVLKNGVLTYSKESSKPSEVGRIHLSDVSDVRPSTRKGKANIIEVLTPYRVFVIKADNDKDQQSWIEYLKKAKQELKARSESTSLVSPSVTAANPGEAQKKVGVEDFDLLTTVGKGSFGKVLQVRKKDSGKIYAMKVLDKAHIIEANEMEHTRAEKKILQMLHHPFLVNLYYSFQTETKLYLVMDFINGGELFHHLQQEKMFSLERVTYYGAEIVLALGHLHDGGIIYRDLKPENLLLTAEGHIVMTDFGLCKDGMAGRDAKTGTFCGTPEYIAPEILQGKSYGKEVDWWSYGCLIYEMLTGLPPFYSQDVEEMYRKILTAKVYYPKHLTEEAKDLIAKLLDRDPPLRLADAATIKNHPFFKGMDWDKLYKKQLKPPYIPQVKNQEDVTHIDTEFTSEKPVIEEDKSAKIDPNMQDTFNGFTFVQSNLPVN